MSHDRLLEVLATIRKYPEVLEYSNKDLDKTFHARFNAVRMQIPIDNVDGSQFTWELADPCLLLAKVLHRHPPPYATPPPRENLRPEVSNTVENRLAAGVIVQRTRCWRNVSPSDGLTCSAFV